MPECCCANRSTPQCDKRPEKSPRLLPCSLARPSLKDMPSADTSSTPRNQPCPCGSGKKHKHCCGKSPLPAVGNATEQTLSRIMADLQGGRHLGALKLARQASIRYRSNPLAHYLHGFAALETGHADEAVSEIRSALSGGLADPAAFHHLGRALVVQSAYADAIDAFTQALARMPQLNESRLLRANCLFELGRFTEAAQEFQQLHRQGPPNAQLLHNLAHAGYASGLLSADAALEHLEQASTLAPDQPLHRASQAQILESCNRHAEAQALAEKILERAPGNAAASIALARVLSRQGKYSDALTVLGRCNQDGAPGDAMAIAMEQARALDKLGQPAAALTAARSAKQLQASTRPASASLATLASELQRDREFMTRIPPDKDYIDLTASLPTPVFIVGFYRCGSTLLEQMLGMHPAVLACGESSALGSISNELGPSPLETLVKCSLREKLRFAKKYLQHHSKDTGNAYRFIVDKQLNNLLRLPLIHMLLPHARIIHVLRHPLDCALSAQLHLFLDAPPWANSLHDTAAFFGTAWAHVEASCVLPGLHYHRIRYEDLVIAPESTLRAAANFIGIDWRPEMLEFHRSPRVARTASYAQVARPIYKDALGHYRNYLPHLEQEIVATIGPVVHASGYTI